MSLALSGHQTRLLRLQSQRLYPLDAPALTTPAQVLEAVFAVQAQDLPAARLSMRARSPGISSAEVERARQVERSIVWTWLPRGTLHLLTTEDAGWLLALLGPGLAASDRRRFEELGWDETRYENAVQVLTQTLEESGALSRQEIRELLVSHGLPEAGQATVHLLYRMAMEGILIAGAHRGKKPTYALCAGWLGGKPPVEELARPQALERLARRYLQAYAPATAADLAKWSGLPAGEARQGFESLAGELVEVQAAGQPALILKSQLPALEAILHQSKERPPAVSLLPRFDTYLLGHVNRDLAVNPAYAGRILTGGIIQPVVLVNGRAVGVWKVERRKGHVQVLTELFEAVGAEVLARVEAEAAAVEDWVEGIATAGKERLPRNDKNLLPKTQTRRPDR